MDSIKTLTESLHNKNLLIQDRCQIYIDLQTALNLLIASQKTFEDSRTFRQILSIAKLDVFEDNLANMQLLVLEMVNLLFKCKWRDTVLVKVPEEYIQLAFDNLEECTNAQTIAQSIVQSCIQKLITREVYDIENEFVSLDSEEKITKMIHLIDAACKDIPTSKCINFCYDNIITVLFRTNNVKFRMIILKYAQQLLSRYPIKLLSNNKLKVFKEKVKNIYVPQINILYECGDQNWDKLWKFIVQCCGTMIHSNVDIMNKLLKPVELSFRSNIIQAKCVAYECWMALISNFALDLDYFCMSKQMKLIMIPLQHAVLKNKTIIKKRFEVWIHLIKALKGRYYQCLEPFLISCFGAFDQPPCIFQDFKKGETDIELYQGYSLSLLEIMGHCDHEDGIICTSDLTYSVDIGEPIINTINFDSLTDLILHSIGQCTSWMIYLFDSRSIKRLVNCMWGSLFRLMKNLPRFQQEDISRKISNWLVLYVKEVNNSRNYLQPIVQPILKLLVQKTILPEDLCSITLFLPIIKGFVEYNFHQELSPSSMEIISILIEYGSTNNGKEVFFKELFTIFTKFNISYNFHNYMYFWSQCSDTLIELQHNSKMNINPIVESVGKEYMIRPIHDLGRIDNKTLSNKFYKKWGCTYLEIYKYHPLHALAIIDEIRSIACNSLEFAGKVCYLYNTLNISISTNLFNEEYVFSILNLTLDLLKFEDTNAINAELLLETIVTVLHYMSQKNNITSKIIMVLCHCCSYMLNTYKIISILDPLEKYLALLPSNCKEYIPIELVNTLTNLKMSNDESILPKVNKISTIVSNSTQKEKPAQIKCTQKSRGEKITDMLKISNTFSLFGKTNVQSDDFKKSKVENTTSNSTKLLNIDDDDETNYVLINKECEFKMDKLNDHQLEKLCKVKSDIPALYQDLSQSQSNSQLILDKYSEISKTNDIEIKNKNSMTTDDTSSQETLTEVNGEEDKIKDQEEANKNEQPLTNTIETIEEKVNKSEEANKNEQPFTNTIETREEKVNKSEDTLDLKINLQIQNPTIEKIEAIITNNSENNDKEKPSSEEEDNDVTKLLIKGKLLKNEKLEKELKKIKMDIVGGDKVIQNLDWNSKIRTRKRFDLVDSKKTSNNRSHSLDANKQNNNNSDSNKTSTKSTLQNEQVSQENVVVESTKRKRKSKQFMVRKSLKRNQKSDVNQNENKNELPKENSSDDNLKTVDVPNSLDIIESSQDTVININLPPILDAQIHECVTDNKIGSSNVNITDIMEVDDSRIHSSELTETNIETIVADLNQALENAADLPTSPINSNTPSRTSELIRDTLDISPIRPEMEIEPLQNQTMDKENAQTEIDNVSVKNQESYSSVDINLKKLPIVFSEICLVSDKEDIMTTAYDKEDIMTPAYDKEDIMTPVYDKEDITTPTSYKEDITTPTSYKEDITTPASHKEDITTPTSYKEDITTPASHKEDIMTPMSHKEDFLTPVSNREDPLTPVSNKDDILTPGSHKEDILTPLSHKANVRKPRILMHSQINRGMKIINQVEKVQAHIKEDNNDKVENVEVKKDYLEFIRVLPSAMASPKNSILKRKASEVLDEGLSPPRKLKRVSFSDPPMTCKKLYIKDDSEHQWRDVQNNTVDDAIPTSLPVDSNKDVAHIEEVPEQAKKEEQVQVQGTSNVKDIELELSTTVISKVVPMVEEEAPIFSSLVDCKENIIKILPLIISAQATMAVAQDLQNKNIHTIGDLAKMSEKSIEALNIYLFSSKRVQAALVLYSDVVNTKLQKPTVSESLLRLHLTSLPVTSQSPISKYSIEKKPSYIVSTNGKKNLKVINSIAKMEERKKLQTILPTFIQDFEKMKKKALQQGLRISSLCETIIEIVGPETFISILQDNKILSISHFLKKDNRNKLVQEIVENMGTKNFLQCLCQIPGVSSIKIIKIIFELVKSKDIKSPNENLMSCLFEFVPLSSIVEQVGVFGIFKEIYGMCKKETISKENVFKTLMHVFNPNIDDLVPSFQHINIVQIQDITVCRSECVQKDLNKFASRILSTIDESTRINMLNGNNVNAINCTELINDSHLESASGETIVKACLKLMQQLNRKNELRPNFNQLLLCMCDNIPLSEIFQFFSTYFKDPSK